MESESSTSAVDTPRQRKASGVSLAIFLICLGILVYTGWWWPGIMIALGLAGGAEQVFRGKIVRGIVTLLLFCSIPIIVWIVQAVAIPWTLLAPLILIGVGIIILVKVVFLGQE